MLRMCFYMHLVPRKIPRLCSAIERPNITGAVSGSYGGYINSPNVSSTGSLKAIEKATYVAQPSGAQMRYTLAFDASDSSNIYSSDSVQPEAFQVLIIIKI